MNIKKTMRGNNKVTGGCFSALGLIIIVLATAFAAFTSLEMFIETIGEVPYADAFLLALLVLYVLYIILIRGPTALGAQAASELEGFKMYLKTAEEHRLNLLTPPERTPELFEKLLPYAIALGVENKWGEKFTDVLKRANYNPEWYNNNNKPFSAAHFPSTISRSFNSSIRSAKINPSGGSPSSGSRSWSSGSGGGGRSGGGGGGGGSRGR
jgi:uncharacterized membrane protein